MISQSNDRKVVCCENTRQRACKRHTRAKAERFAFLRPRVPPDASRRKRCSTRFFFARIAARCSLSCPRLWRAAPPWRRRRRSCPTDRATLARVDPDRRHRLHIVCSVILIGQYDSPFVRRVGIALRLYDLTYRHEPWSAWGMPTLPSRARFASLAKRIRVEQNGGLSRPLARGTPAAGGTRAQFFSRRKSFL